jgi:N-acylneuraminate cytidylyltransferase
MSKNNIIALIPARGGSKSIPRKNLINILDKPLLAWSIQQAKESKYISRVIVSTDDAEIAEVASNYGAEVPFIRPQEFSQDESTDFDVFKHAINWLNNNENYQPEMIVHLRPTGPARYVSFIDKAIKIMLDNKDYDSLRSISLSNQTPFKMWFVENEKMISIGSILGSRESHSMPRQKLKKAYWQNGYVDIVKPKAFYKFNSMVGKNPYPFIIHHDVHDIDYLDDISFVEEDLKTVIRNNFIAPEDDIQERFPV